jgi:hypothetical protein
LLTSCVFVKPVLPDFLQRPFTLARPTTHPKSLECKKI